MVGNHVEALELDGRLFRFELCRRAIRMGPVPVDHWWMDTRRVYGQRGRSATVRDALTGYFWALCQHHETDAEPDVQESYLLAGLLPRAQQRRPAGLQRRPPGHDGPRRAAGPRRTTSWSAASAARATRA